MNILAVILNVSIIFFLLVYFIIQFKVKYKQDNFLREE